MKTVAVIILASALMSGCGAAPMVGPTPVKDQQALKAQQAANGLNFTENAEIDNITRRLKLTANPGQLGYVLLMNEAGQPIMYTSVKGKITSGSKRLTPPEKAYSIDCGEYCRETLGSGPSDEGTYGASGEYVFFWTMEGQYIQWNGKYLYSDKPFRTNVQPLVIENRAAS